MRTLITALALSFALFGCQKSKEETPASSDNTTTTSPSTDNTDTPDAEAPPMAGSAQIMKLNLNTAAEATFKTIPNVGDKMAHEFEEYRPYTSISQFRREMSKYVDADQISAYERYVYVPIKINDCDAATLQQIDGVDETIANAIIAARPFESHDAFITMLKDHVGESKAEMARTYLDE